jgi:hypothetical protein
MAIKYVRDNKYLFDVPLLRVIFGKIVHKILDAFESLVLLINASATTDINRFMHWNGGHLPVLSKKINM